MRWLARIALDGAEAAAGDAVAATDLTRRDAVAAADARVERVGVDEQARVGGVVARAAAETAVEAAGR